MKVLDTVMVAVVITLVFVTAITVITQPAWPKDVQACFDKGGTPVLQEEKMISCIEK